MSGWYQRGVKMGKIRLQVTIREDIVKWIDKQVDSRKFASRSHAMEYALLQLIDRSDKA